MRLVRFLISLMIVLSLAWFIYQQIPTPAMIRWTNQLGKGMYLVYPFAFLLLFLIIETLLSRMLHLLDRVWLFLIGMHYGLMGTQNKENRIQARSALSALVHLRYQDAARHFFHAGLFPQSAKCFEKIPDFASAAEMYYKAKEYGTAAEKFNQAEKFESAAECYIMSGDRESAMSCYDHAAKKLLADGKNVLAAEAWLKAHNYLRAGELLEKSGHPEQAADAFDKAGDSLRAAELYFQSAREQSLRLLKHTPQAASPPLPPDMIENAKKAGEKFLFLGMHEKAIEAFDLLGDTEKIAEIYKNNGDFERAAGIYEKAGMWIKARQCYERMGKHTDALRMEAHIAIHNKQLQRAVQLFEELGDYEKALEIFKTLRDAAGQAHCLEKLGRPLAAAHFYAKSNNLPKAAEIFERYGDYERAAEIYHELGMIQQASRCIAKSNNLLYAAMLEREKGNLQNAIEILQTLPHHIPEYPKAMLLLAQCYMDLDQSSLAVDAFERVIPSLIPNQGNIENFYLYGCVLEKTENYHYAREIFQKVRGIKKDYKDLEERMKEIDNMLSQKARISLQDLSRIRSASPPTPPPPSLLKRISDLQEKPNDQPTILESPETVLEDQKTILQDQKTVMEKDIPKNGMEEDQPVPDRFQKIERIGKPPLKPSSLLYKARDRNSAKIVALKIFPLSLWMTQEERTHFFEQFTPVSRLQHPHIVPIYEFGERKNELYISMEFCERGNLMELVEQEGRLAPRESLQLLQRLAEALAYSHNNHIIHGNIKPSNILFTEKGTPKIGDFSLSRLLVETSRSRDYDFPDEKRKTGRLLYMAPEQIRGESPNQLCDIYSLGLIFFFLMTGKSPIDLMGRITPEEIMDAHLFGSFPSLGRIMKDACPKECDEIFTACTQKNPEHRIKRADDIIRLIQMIAV